MSTHHHRSGHVSLIHKLKDKLLGHKDEPVPSGHRAVTTAAVPLFNPPVVAHPVGHSDSLSTAHPVGGCAATGGFASRGVKRDSGKGHSRRSSSHTLEHETKTSSSSDEKRASISRDMHDSHHDDRRASTSEIKNAETLSERVLDVNNSTHLTLHEEQLAVSKREVSAGELDIHKHVKEEYVEKSIPVAREEIVVERRPYSGPDSERIPEKDEIARVLLYREEVVTTKRLVPTEEVVVTKNEVTDQQTVEATLRSEYIETTVQNNEPGTNNVSEKLEPAKSGAPLKAARG